MTNVREVTNIAGIKRWVGPDGRSYSTELEAGQATSDSETLASARQAIKQPIFLGFNAELLRPLTVVCVAIIVFLPCWLYAIDSWGWILGLSLGWLPAAVMASVAAWIAFYLWPIILGSGPIEVRATI